MDRKLSVQTYDPPLFEPSGKVVLRTEAWSKGLWIGAFNLWIIQDKPIRSIIYQLRDPNIGWAPNKLDVAVAGHYENLESPTTRMSIEIKEETGKKYYQDNLVFVGRKLNVGIGTDGTQRNTVNDIYIVLDNSPLTTFRPLDKEEVYAFCALELDQIKRVFADENYSFEVEGIKNDGSNIRIKVDKNKFPPNWDNYHFKMVLLIERFFKGEKYLIY